MGEILAVSVVNVTLLVTLLDMKQREKPTQPVVTAREALEMIRDPSCYLVCVN